MQIADTIVLVAAINPRNKNHSLASRYLALMGSDEETFLPIASAIEFDLVMKGRKYTPIQRRDALDWLEQVVPSSKIICNSLISLGGAAELQESRRMGYFDSIVTALAIEKNATVLTPDKQISEITRTKW
ncbi:MAG: PIN domain-containing protein [Nitrososphaerales archaeon]